MNIDLNMSNLCEQPIDPCDEPIEMNIIQELFDEYLINESIEFDPCYFNPYLEDIFDEEIMYMEEVNNLTESTIHRSCSTWKPHPEPLFAEPRSISKPLIEEAPKLELKTLLVNLKYAYLDANKTLPIIIVVDLTTSQEEALLAGITQKPIGWTKTDIKRTSVRIMQYMIQLIDETQLKSDPQMRLNLVMKEVVKNDILKSFW